MFFDTAILGKIVITVISILSCAIPVGMFFLGIYAIVRQIQKRRQALKHLEDEDEDKR